VLRGRSNSLSEGEVFIMLWNGTLLILYWRFPVAADLKMGRRVQAVQRLDHSSPVYIRMSRLHADDGPDHKFCFVAPGGRRMPKAAMRSASAPATARPTGPRGGEVATSSTLLRCRQKAGQTHSPQLHLNPCHE